jgi:methionyl-tRNA formyltransferase
MARTAGLTMVALRTVLITDPNLGEEAHARLSRHCSDLVWFSWDIDRPDDAEDILAQIGDRSWDLAISFYSDLILPPLVLDTIRLPLNIHPALPRIRGVGHDIVPLVERHTSVGVTLHRMEPAVDTGEIFDVLEVPLRQPQTYPSLRLLNQSTSLDMLDRLLARIACSSNLAELEGSLKQKASQAAYRWGAYYSRKKVAKLRHEYEVRHNSNS